MGSDLGGLERIARHVEAIAKRFSLAAKSLPRIDIEPYLRGTLLALDRITPIILRPLQLDFGARVAELVTGPSTLAAMREALAAQARIAEALSRPQWVEAIQAMTATKRQLASAMAPISESIARMASLTEIRLGANVATSLAKTMRAWEGLARRLPPAPTELDIERFGSAGRGALSIVATATVIGGRAGDAGLADPWQEAPADLRNEMRRRLAAIDSSLVQKLDGAWDRLERPGPDAASQAATSLVELVDWFLRGAASDGAVLSWHAKGSRAERELHEGRPTRALRARYLLRTREPDGELASTYVQALTVFLAELQGFKHSAGEQDLLAVRRILPGIEALITFILV